MNSTARRSATSNSKARRALSLGFQSLAPGQTIAVTTPTFSPRDVLNMRTYDLMATPLVYPGQVVKARVIASRQQRRRYGPAAHPGL